MAQSMGGKASSRKELLVWIAGLASCFPEIKQGDDMMRVSHGVFDIIEERDRLRKALTLAVQQRDLAREASARDLELRRAASASAINAATGGDR